LTLTGLARRGLKWRWCPTRRACRVAANLRAGAADYFDAVVTHDDTGVRKPEPKPFLMALDRLKLKPEEVIMVGTGWIATWSAPECWCPANRHMRAQSVFRLLFLAPTCRDPPSPHHDDFLGFKFQPIQRH